MLDAMSESLTVLSFGLLVAIRLLEKYEVELTSLLYGVLSDAYE